MVLGAYECLLLFKRPEINSHTGWFIISCNSCSGGVYGSNRHVPSEQTVVWQEGHWDRISSPHFVIFYQQSFQLSQGVRMLLSEDCYRSICLGKKQGVEVWRRIWEGGEQISRQPPLCEGYFIHRMSSQLTFFDTTYASLTLIDLNINRHKLLIVFTVQTFL